MVGKGTDCHHIKLNSVQFKILTAASADGWSGWGDVVAAGAFSFVATASPCRVVRDVVAASATCVCRLCSGSVAGLCTYIHTHTHTHTGV